MNFINKYYVAMIALCCFIYADYNEENILELIKHYVPENPIVLEAGACDGTDTIKLSAMWPKGIIHTFEPEPRLIPLLTKNLASCKNVIFYPYALSDRSGKAQFYVETYPNGRASLLFPKMRENYQLGRPVEVECLTLDEWANRYHISHIDFMWLDMEGIELQMLKASSRIIHTVRVIYTEVNYQEYRINNTFYNDMKAWLEEQGFREVWNKPFCGVNAQANVLFVR